MNTESVLQLHWGPGQSAHNCTCLLEICNVIFYEHRICLDKSANRAAKRIGGAQSKYKK